MAMYGADIGELRALAAQFDRTADQLDGCRGALGGQVHSSPWVGADAARFKGDWSSQHAPRLNETACRLREAARSLRRNADDQEKTSAVDGGPVTASDTALSALLDHLRQAVDAGLFTTDILGVLEELTKYGEIIPKPVAGALGGLSVLLSGVDALNDISDGEYLSAALNWTNASVGLVALAAPVVAPLALGVGAFVGLVDVGLPITGERQDETYAAGARNLFGRNVDVDHLTSEQAQRMATRYEGGMGVLNMISDSMDSFAEKAFPWNWGH